MRLEQGPDCQLVAASRSYPMERLDEVIREEASHFEAQARVLVKTSAFRSGDTGLHGKGLAADYDLVWREDVPPEEQRAILQYVANRTQLRVGADYDVLAHGPRWHVHGEYDPKTEKPVGEGFYQRVAATRGPRG